jgi:hypothetical protein
MLLLLHKFYIKFTLSLKSKTNLHASSLKQLLRRLFLMEKNSKYFVLEFFFRGVGVRGGGRGKEMTNF